MHAVFTDKAGQGVKGGHQDDEGRNDAGDEAHEYFTALLEDADEVRGQPDEPAALGFLRNILQLLAQLVGGHRIIDEDHPCSIGTMVPMIDHGLGHHRQMLCCIPQVSHHLYYCHRFLPFFGSLIARKVYACANSGAAF